MSESGNVTNYEYAKRLAKDHYRGNINKAYQTAIYREFKRCKEEEHGTGIEHRIQEHKGIKTL